MAQVHAMSADHSRRGPPDADRPDQARVVMMRGEHDPSTTVALSQALSSAIAVDDADLVVDASEVTFLDASTIGVLLGARSFLLDHSRSLQVRSPSACVRRIVDICDLGVLYEGDDDTVEPVRLGALETWVAVPATSPEHPAQSAPDDTPSRDVTDTPIASAARGEATPIRSRP